MKMMSLLTKVKGWFRPAMPTRTLAREAYWVAHRLGRLPKDTIWSLYLNDVYVDPANAKALIVRKGDHVRIVCMIPQTEHHNVITWTYSEVIKED